MTTLWGPWSWNSWKQVWERFGAGNTTALGMQTSANIFPDPPLPQEPQTSRNLVRTRGGAMIHRAECYMAQRGKAAPWDWADTVSEAEVASAIMHMGYRRCNRCKPLPAFMNQQRRTS